MKKLQKLVSNLSEERFNQFLKDLYQEGINSGNQTSYYHESNKGDEGAKFEEYSEKELIDLIPYQL